MQPHSLVLLTCLPLLLLTIHIQAMPIPPERVEQVLEIFEGGFLPFEQVSVTIGDEPGSFTFCWVSGISDTPSVYYLGQQYIGKTFTYKRKGIKYPSYISGNIHKVAFNLALLKFAAVHSLFQVQISGVPDSSNVSYNLAVGQTIDATRSFLTPPKVGPDSPITIAVVGDWGQTDNSVKTGQHMLDANASITLIAGDLSYADGFQPYWDSWGRMAEALLSSRPFMAAPGSSPLHFFIIRSPRDAARELRSYCHNSIYSLGNHEIEEDLMNNPSQFVAFQTRFRFPSVASNATAGNLYYSFDSGPAHIVMLCSYCPYKSHSPQYRWLVSDLKRVDRSRTPWVIAVLHAPWYNSNRAHHNEGEEVQMREAMERIFYDSKVDLVLAGHVHAYERSHPVFQGRIVPDAPVYITIGDGGNREGLAANYETAPIWSAYRLAAFGHGVIDIKNATHLLWEWKRNDASVHVFVNLACCCTEKQLH